MWLMKYNVQCMKLHWHHANTDQTQLYLYSMAWHMARWQRKRRRLRNYADLTIYATATYGQARLVLTMCHHKLPATTIVILLTSWYPILSSVAKMHAVCSHLPHNVLHSSSSINCTCGCWNCHFSRIKWTPRHNEWTFISFGTLCTTIPLTDARKLWHTCMVAAFQPPVRYFSVYKNQLLASAT